MKKTVSTIAIILTFICFSTSLIAQENISAENIIKKASDACKQLRSIEYTIDQTPLDNRVPNIKVKIIQQKMNISKKAGFDSAYIIADGKLDETDFKFAFNGEVLQYQNSKGKELLTLKDPTQMSSMQTIGLDLLLSRIFPFTNDKGFDNMYESIELKNKHEIKDNQPCYRLEFYRTNSRTGKKIITSWWISKKDFLPRALETNTYNKEISIKSINQVYDKNVFKINSTSKDSKKTITSEEIEDNYAKEGLLPIGKKLSDWSLTDSNGKQRKLLDFRGKIVLIDFWGTWCVPCIKVMPDIQKLHDDFKDSGLVVMGLAVNDPIGKPQKLFKKKGFDYMLFPKGDKVSKQYDVKVFPTLYILNKKGEIIYAHKGFQKGLYNKLKKVIQKEL